jgi:hypothetical protein
MDEYFDYQFYGSCNTTSFGNGFGGELLEDYEGHGWGDSEEGNGIGNGSESNQSGMSYPFKESIRFKYNG